MRGKGQGLLDFTVDRLTDSIVNAVSGERLPTEVLPFTRSDVKGITKKAGWKFNWKSELANRSRDVCKLVIRTSPGVIQGLLSVQVKGDHIVTHLLENAPFNIGKGKVYEGVAGNLVAFGCQLSFKHGLEGYVMFFAKTMLIEHYRLSLGAVHIGGQRMVIDTIAARNLGERYFKS